MKRDIKSRLILVALVVLLVISIAQGFQINELKQNGITTNSQSSFGSAIFGSGSNTANTNTNTPTMVGGC